MRRSDGYKLKGCDPFYEIIPHIMPHRYDAANYIDLELDLDTMQKYIRRCRQKGIKMDHMSVMISAYLRLVSQNPNLNRFVCNKKIYARNHFCVCFTTLKPAGGMGEETVTKVYFNLSDTIFEVNRKVSEAIAVSRISGESNAMDSLLRKIMRVPFLVRSTVSFLKFWDKYVGLPFAVVNGSPFHTSLFITNLASIRLRPVYHHIYEFGTTGIFIAMGQPERRLVKIGEIVEEHKVMPVKVSCDDRVESGYYYARCFREFQRYLRNPEILEEAPAQIIPDPNLATANRKFIVR